MILLLSDQSRIMIKELLVVLRTRRQVDSELEFQIKLAADNGDANN